MISVTLTASSGARGILKNADTGQPIRWSFWFDLETGEYKAFRMDPKAAKARGIPLPSIVYHGRTRLRWEPTAIVQALPTAPVPAPVVDHSRRRQFARCLALQDRPCQRYGCNRLATWKVADEVLLPPVEADGRKFETAETVGVRFYCEHHYKLPKLFDRRGELIGEQEVKARPD